MVLPYKIIHTRVSTDMQDSHEDQERTIREGLARKGIDTTGAIVINEHAESGEDDKRPQFAQIRAWTKAGLVAWIANSEQSRLSRGDNIRALIQDLKFNGGRYFAILDGIDTDDPGSDMLIGVKEVLNKQQNRETAKRVRQGQEGRVLDGDGADSGYGSAGDYCFGYTSEYIDPDWAMILAQRRRPKKRVLIDQAQAVVVVWIFQKFVDGWSMTRIARHLTRDKIPKDHRASTPTWRAQLVGRVLRNSKYIGLWPWGFTRTIRDSETRKKQNPVKEHERRVVKRPGLRIVPQDLWDAAQRRLADLDEKFGLKPGQKPRGPRPGRPGKAAKHHASVIYPQTIAGGLLFCRACGARMHTGSRRGKRFLYCPAYRHGRCHAATTVLAEAAESSLVELAVSILTGWPDWMAVALLAMRDHLKILSKEEDTTTTRDRRRLAEARLELDNCLKAIKRGVVSAEIDRAITELNAEIPGLEHSVAASARLLQGEDALPDDDWVREQVTKLVPLVVGDAEAAATVLRKLFGKVYAEGVIAPGKKRGFARLTVTVSGCDAILTAVEHARKESALTGLFGDTVSRSEAGWTVTLDLGSPTRRDWWAPQIDEMRRNGQTWPQIGVITGLGSGNAYNVWKRWRDAQPGGEGRDAA